MITSSFVGIQQAIRHIYLKIRTKTYTILYNFCYCCIIILCYSEFNFVWNFFWEIGAFGKFFGGHTKLQYFPHPNDYAGMIFSDSNAWHRSRFSKEKYIQSIKLNIVYIGLTLKMLFFNMPKKYFSQSPKLHGEKIVS